MRTTNCVAVSSLVITLAMAAAISHAGPGAAAAVAGPSPETVQETPDAGCDNSCRGLGLEKVKAGDEHCGLIPRARKDESLDAACQLAAAHRDDLQERAEERVREKCAEELDRSECECRIELREWQNVYTHVFSQNCWTECGWAALVECERPAADQGEAEDG